MRFLFLLVAVAFALAATGRVRADEITVKVKESGPATPGLFQQFQQWNASRAKLRWVKPQPIPQEMPAAPAERKPLVAAVPAAAPAEPAAAKPAPTGKPPLRVIVERQ